MRALSLAALALVLVGCGAPSSTSKQAEDVASVAAEGALLARDAAEGSTLGPFARVHARALREQLEQLAPSVGDARLARLVRRIELELDRLAGDPSDQRLAARVRRALGRAADEASRLAR